MIKLKVKKFLIFILNLLFFLFIYLLSFFINIKIGRIYTNRVGHICYNLDYLLNSLIKDKKKIIFLGTDKIVANKFLLKLFKRKNRLIFFSRFYFYFYYFIKNNFPKSKFLLNYNYDLHPKFSLTSRQKSLINFTKKEILIGDNFIKKNKISGKFVILHNRSKDADIFFKNDKNFHDYRNFNFQDYQKTIKYCNKKKIKVLRFGFNPLDKKFKKKIKLFDFNRSSFSELEQLFLIYKSKIVISSNTGFLNIATVFRKPSLMINTLPLVFNNFDARTVGSVIVPKKIFDLKKKSYLKINEMMNLGKNIHNKKNIFESKNLKVVDNSQNEILNAFIEINEKLNDKLLYKKKYKKIKQKLDKVFSKNKYYHLLDDKLDINFSYSFLKKNKFLL